jgi:hypothetical protein
LYEYNNTGFSLVIVIGYYTTIRLEIDSDKIVSFPT